MAKPKAGLTEVRYVYNQVYKSTLSGRFYFAKKVRVLSGGLCEVIGQKFDVTDSIEGLLKSERKTKAKP